MVTEVDHSKIEYFTSRKEAGVLTEPTFEVSVIFGKRDEVTSMHCIFLLDH